MNYSRLAASAAAIVLSAHLSVISAVNQPAPEPATAEAPTETAPPKVDVDLDMRMDFTAEHDHTTGINNSGFHGRYFNLHINGNISKEFSYHIRQRLNKQVDASNDIFAATDWAHLDYQPTANFRASAGKQVVLIGGYEYDAAPIDVYFSSRFWNNIACFQFGASATYITDNKNHELSAQITNSPYAPIGDACYAYNLFWNGHIDLYRSLWSFNVIEYARGHYATFIALGNRFSFGPLDLQIDLMNRHFGHGKYFFKDYSVIAKAEYAVTPWLTVMAKGGKDDIRPLPDEPIHIDRAFWGGGLEFFPLKGSRNVRIHAIYDVYHDNNSHRISELNLGIKWRTDLFSR